MRTKTNHCCTSSCIAGSAPWLAERFEKVAHLDNKGRRRRDGGRAKGCAHLDENVEVRGAAEGGRVYFAKDSRLDARMVPRMYPRLDEWRAVRDRLDPHGALTSDLDRRLDLTGHRR